MLFKKDNKLSIMNFIKKRMQIFDEELTQCEKLRVNAENEYQAMSCGAFNPRFLAKIRRSRAGNNTNKNKEKIM